MVKLRGKVTGRVWEITPADIHFVPKDEWLEPGEFYVEVEGNRFYYGPEASLHFSQRITALRTVGLQMNIWIWKEYRPILS